MESVSDVVGAGSDADDVVVSGSDDDVDVDVKDEGGDTDSGSDGDDAVVAGRETEGDAVDVKSTEAGAGDARCKAGIEIGEAHGAMKLPRFNGMKEGEDASRSRLFPCKMFLLSEDISA